MKENLMLDLAHALRDLGALDWKARGFSMAGWSVCAFGLGASLPSWRAARPAGWLVSDGETIRLRGNAALKLGLTRREWEYIFLPRAYGATYLDDVADISPIEVAGHIDFLLKGGEAPPAE